MLGIITAAGEVIFAEAEPDVRPGHQEWLRSEPWIEAIRGFSASVKRGRVQDLYTVSTLNPRSQNHRLTRDEVAELLDLLPLAIEYNVYEH